MYDSLARRAILAALANNWQTALETNLFILSEEPDDVDALNRAAHAHMQLGDLDNAVQMAERVLSIDPLNSIADKCLTKCTLLASDHGISINKSVRVSDVFLEIPGRTKIVSLINLCESVVLAQLDAGDNVQLMPKTRKVAVTTPNEIYIGRLPDDLATRIIYFIKNGNVYETYIKSVSGSEVKVFIKETKRSDSLDKTPSFPARR